LVLISGAYFSITTYLLHEVSTYRIHFFYVYLLSFISSFVLAVTVITSLLTDIVFYKINDYLSINRFTASLSMRTDVDLYNVDLYRRIMGLNRVEFLSLMFEEGIGEIKNRSKFNVPILFFKKELSVTTNYAIFSVMSKKFDIKYHKVKEKAVGEKVMFLSWKQMHGIIFKPRRFSKLIKHLTLPTKIYHINIPLK
jgi:hypothetical protein